MPFTIINNIRMHFEVGGKGDPVLLINGLSAPAANWALQAKALAPHFTVVTFDNRGVDETDLPGEPVYSTGQLADDAAALLKHLKIARAHVVGASMGGTIAMEIAATTAARPLAVPRVHVGGGRRSLPAHARVVDIARLPCADRGALSAHALPLAVHARVLREEGERRAGVPALHGRSVSDQGRGHRSAGQGDHGLERHAAREARRCPRATLVLVGTDDILTPPAFSRQVARAIRRARLVVMPGGHGFFLEHADQFNRTLLRFPEVGPLHVALGPANALGDGGRRLNVSRGT